MRNRIIALMIVAVAALCGWADRAHAAAPDKPNILVFLVDDMGLMDTSEPFIVDQDGKPESHPLNAWYRTPSMQRLAAQGVRFSQFYAMSVCSPSRVSIMTGQTSARHHTTQYIKPESNNRGTFGPPDWRWTGIAQGDVTLPALLKTAGYRTLFAGKGHFGPNDSFGALPQHFGFDVNIAGCAYGQPGSYLGTENFGHGIKGREKRAVPGLDKYFGKDIFLTEALTLEMNAAIDDSVKAGKPFFAYMAHYAVHAPFMTDPRFKDDYGSSPEGVIGKGQAVAFATMIEGMDKSLGDMLDHLEQLGVAENTLVLFMGDNGTDAPQGAATGIACSAPLRGKKGTHYEGGMRVPFIAAWAKRDPNNSFQKALPIPAGRIVTTEFGAVYDVFATALAVAGVDNPAGHAIDGVDLRPVLSGQRDTLSDTPRAFLMHFPHQHRSSYFTVYRRGDWKVIYHYEKPAEDRYELFNLAADRSESNNLASSDPAKLREMMTSMVDALHRADAQYPVDQAGKAVEPVVP
ncbi:MAG: sulfatase-like hydrolase/transferase [Phycisphaera sp.]|nr:sulfatase-like hydrolase/transferase [Phycisphaera sp.]